MLSVQTRAALLLTARQNILARMAGITAGIFDVSTATETQQQWIRNALERCSFDFSLLLPKLASATGRTSIVVRFVEFADDTFGNADNAGVIEINEALDEDTAMQTFLSEAAHMVDFFYLTDSMRSRITDVYVLENHLTTRPAWFHVQLLGETYYAQVGESFMTGFTKAFSDVLVGDSEFKHYATPSVVEAIRDIVQPPRMLAANRDSNSVHKAADANYKALMLVVSAAFLRGKKAYKSSGLDAAVSAIRASLLATLPTALERAYAAGSRAGRETLGRLLKSSPRAAGAVLRALKPKTGKTPRLKAEFNKPNPAAKAWAKSHATELAKELSETSRERIKNAVARSFDADGNKREMFDEILEAVGDEARADMIARSESMTAAAEGQRGEWESAVEEGLLTGNEKVVWIATSGACADCSEMDGETRDIDGEYDGVYQEVPGHPNCRCTEGISDGVARNASAWVPRGGAFGVGYMAGRLGYGPKD